MTFSSDGISASHRSKEEVWPDLPLEAWKETCATLHLWNQIVGKVRLGHSPWLNHSWQSALYVTARGLTTSPLFSGTRSFQIDLDFIDQRLVLETSDDKLGGFLLTAEPVAEFYRRLMGELKRLEIPTKIDCRPNEIPEAIPFDRDTQSRTYDGRYAERFWRILVQADRIFKEFRGRFIGKCSPVHFFWGAQDLAVTRFSGRPAPPHPGGIPNLPDRVTREAYSHEVSSAGFWPGGGPIAYPAFYSYAYPEPRGFADAKLAPSAAFYSKDLGEFILPYDAVREAEFPDQTLLSFLQSSYEAAARLAGWDRKALELTSQAPTESRGSRSREARSPDAHP